MAENFQASNVRAIRGRFQQARDMGHDDRTATDVANGKISLDEANERKNARKAEEREAKGLEPLDNSYQDEAGQNGGKPRKPLPTGQRADGADGVSIPENYAELPWNALRALAKSIRDEVVRGKEDAVAIIEEELGRREAASRGANDGTEQAGNPAAKNDPTTTANAKDGLAAAQPGDLDQTAERAGKRAAQGKTDDVDPNKETGKGDDKNTASVSTAKGDDDDDDKHVRLEGGNK